MAGDDAIRVGSMLFTLVDPHVGHEVAYHRWYERDHFYAGCLVGPWLFAGRRWVCTSDLKAQRPLPDSALLGDPRAGSYLATYWIQDGHHQEHVDWALKQVLKLHAEGRMFPHRDHVHTLLYEWAWTANRDADGVPLELALDHAFAGLLATIVERPAATAADAHDAAAAVTTALSGTPVALCAGFAPIPLPDDAPVTQPGLDHLDRKELQLWFLDAALASADWTALLASIAEATGGEVRWASAFLPTIPGTDTYTDQLW